MDQNAALRAYLAKALDWQEAHAGFEKVVDAWPSKLRGTRPEGLPYSAWQLIEHTRFTQHDILEFCRNPKYVEPHWPDDYWPPTGAPPSSAAWNKSVAAFRRDRDALKHLANDPEIDLFAKIPHGSGQTYLRELLLIVDHNAYHLGELVAVRRLLGAWK